MSKFEIIEHIRKINATARPDFLSSFSDDDLLAYLHQLQEVERDQVQRCRREPVLVGAHE